jgi:hypothetical protein
LRRVVSKQPNHATQVWVFGNRVLRVLFRLRLVKVVGTSAEDRVLVALQFFVWITTFGIKFTVK